MRTIYQYRYRARKKGSQKGWSNWNYGSRSSSGEKDFTIECAVWKLQKLVKKYPEYDFEMQVVNSKNDKVIPIRLAEVQITTFRM